MCHYVKQCLLAIVFMMLASLSLAGPTKNLWPRWQTHNPESKQTINHKAFQTFLDQYVVKTESGINAVKYSQVNDQDKSKLSHYIKYLSNIDIDDYNRDVQMAYWINLYNALTIQLVLNHYPVKSIRDINLNDGWLTSLFGGGPWDAKLIRVENKRLSLNDIEHRILRPIWKDARIHYAVNCASYSCPNLSKQVYKASRLDNMLNRAAKNYVNSPRGVSVHNGNLRVSSIYKWYRPDFGNSVQGVIKHLKQYAEPQLKQKLQHVNSITSYHYNWQLNSLKNIKAT